MKKRYAVLCLIVGVLLFGIYETEPNIPKLAILGGVLISLAVTAFAVRIVQNTAARPAPQQQFTLEQLTLMRGLVKNEMQSIEEQREAILEKGARKGKTIETEAVLRVLEASKATHQGVDRAAYAAAADKLAQEFREQYPDKIPLDDARKLMKKWE